jgi:hypothetical protein
MSEYKTGIAKRLLITLIGVVCLAVLNYKFYHLSDCIINPFNFPEVISVILHLFFNTLFIIIGSAWVGALACGILWGICSAIWGIIDWIICGG